MQKQRLQQNQKIKLSAQQIQFLNLLQIPLISLEKRIEKELEENPALEEMNKEDENSEDWEESSGSYYYNKNENFKQPILAEREETIQEFLLKQLPLHNLEEKQLRLAEFLIGCLDSNGFLTRDLISISDDLVLYQNINVSEEELASVLFVLQSLDPPGVGAIDLQDCLVLQLNRKEKNTINDLSIKLLKEQYAYFRTKNFDKLLNALNVSEQDLKAAFVNISKLNPKPGSGFLTTQEGVPYIAPDFILNVVNGVFDLQLNNKGTSRISASKQYKKMLEELQSSSKKDAVIFLKNKLDSAQWFVNALKQRENTLLKSMNCILQLQSSFFESGDFKDLKPMKLMDVAQKVKLDLSTISRVTNSKYIETPFGTFLLKDFFSEAYSKDDGTTISTKVIKSHLTDLLLKEDKKNPYTDEELSDILGQKGYHIARRTVSKYREKIGFLTSRLRKEL